MRKTTTFFLIILVIFFGCGKETLPVLKVVDRINNKMIVLAGDRMALTNFYDADFVIIGGGLGAIAAAIACCSSGRSTILIEEYDGIAGCFVTDETSEYIDNQYIETSGGSKQYQEFRRRIREMYENKEMPQPHAIFPQFENMNHFMGSDFCFSSDIAIEVVYQMIERHISRERLTILRRHKVAEIMDFNQKIAALHVVDLDSKDVHQVTGWMYIDATRNGYVFPLLGIDHVIGRESRAQTGEPHAPEKPDSSNVYDIYWYKAVNPIGSNVYERDLVAEKPVNTSGWERVEIAKMPRRLKARTVISECDIAAECLDGPRGTFYRDSFGIGFYPIIIPDPNSPDEQKVIETKPFQIPVSALIPVKYTNYISGGPTISSTYIANTAYRAPSVVWAIGEGAGEYAAFCAGNNFNTHESFQNEEDLMFFRSMMVRRRGIPIYWYDNITPDDPGFVWAQLAPFRNQSFHENMKSLNFDRNLLPSGPPGGRPGPGMRGTGDGRNQ